MDRLLTEAEEKMLTGGVSRADIAQARLWNKRPDGIAIKMPTKDKQGEFVILEFKIMSDVTENYLSRARDKAEEQYASLPGLRTLWDTLSHHLGHRQTISETTIRQRSLSGNV